MSFGVYKDSIKNVTHLRRLRMDKWKVSASDGIIEIAQDLIAKYHQHLAVCDSQIAYLLTEKAAKSAGRPVLGKARKASPDINALSGVDYKFVIEIAAPEWQGLSATQRSALIDHLLCHLKVEEETSEEEPEGVDSDPKKKKKSKGRPKAPSADGLIYSIVKPDIGYFHAELKRWGDWRDREEDLGGNAFDVESALLSESPGSDVSEGGANEE